MIVFPAVDIQAGRCVRLLQGRPGASTQYYAEPVEAAMHWEKLGARALHVVDLDAALSESTQNRPHVGEILARLSIPVQCGGGLRSAEEVERVLEAGAARAVVGTRAAVEPEWAVELCGRFEGRIVIALDAREGEVAIKGWREGAGLLVEELAHRLEQGRPAAFLYTDVARDGMLTRPHFDGVRLLLEAGSVPVIASGGVSSLEDLRRLGECGADGAIVGKAFYEKHFSLKEALDVADEFGSRLSPLPHAEGSGETANADRAP
jgi:phosphoribosylformimino-5-aminoimidazole carboxamide ribotide isomerase